MAVARAVYYWQIQDLIGTEAEIQGGTKILRETETAHLLEIRRPFPGEIIVEWPRLIETEAGLELRWRETPWQAKPGDVLYPIWRWATRGEYAHYNFIPDNAWPAGFQRHNGRIRVRIVMHYSSLPEAVRQRMRHIPRSLIGKEVTIDGQPVLIWGDSQQMGDLIRRLAQLTQRFTGQIRVSPELTQESLREIRSVREALQRASNQLKVQARNELASASPESPEGIPLAVAKATIPLIQRRSEDLEAATRVLEQAEAFLKTMAQIEEGFRTAYGSLGKWIMELQTHGLESPKLNEIASGSTNFVSYLDRVATFKPYEERGRSPEVRRLARVGEHIRAGNIKTALNSLRAAAQKIELFAIGEKPPAEELERARRRI